MNIYVCYHIHPKHSDRQSEDQDQMSKQTAVSNQGLHRLSFIQFRNTLRSATEMDVFKV